MYVAHHLLMLKHQFSAQLPESLSSWAAYFVDMVPGVRRTGTECFLNTMRTQRDQLSVYLSAANGMCLTHQRNLGAGEHFVLYCIISGESRYILYTPHP